MEEKKLSIFERYLTIWVLLCIVGGIALGKSAPGVATTLNDFSIYQVSIPIAICLFFMMYPIMVKIDFAQVVKSAKTPKPVFLTLFITKCEFHARTVANYVIFGLNLCGIASCCRLFVKKVDN